MHYKTIALELIQENPELYERLRSSKMLMTAMDAYAIELKASHETWDEKLNRAMPGNDPRQIASEAMELAVQELKERLPSGSPATEADPLSLGAAMRFLRGSQPA
jgi:division protein CdvB (Snf7/Vps24/ESCRT-III family)